MGIVSRLASAVLVASLPLAAHAALGDYKKQKHGERTQVSEESCPAQYVQRCRAGCGATDAACPSRRQ